MSLGAAAVVGLLGALALAHRQGAPRPMTAIVRALPAIVALVGLTALATATTVPLVADAAPAARPAQSNFDPLLRRVRTRADATDPTHLMGADVDGTGRFLTELRPCAGAVFTPFVAPTGTALVPIDSDCDGVVDFYAELVDTTAHVPTAEGTTTVAPASVEIPPTHDHRSYVVAGVAALAMLAAIGGLLVAHRRDRRPPPEPFAPMVDDGLVDRARVARSVAVSVEVMVADPDPRTAIIGAYASLLDGLSTAGLSRRAHEGPQEHLQRCLEALDVHPAPLHTITSLFAEAMFSVHPLGEHQRQAALDALRLAAADLEPVTAGASA